MISIKYLSAVWCGPCKVLAPIMEQIGNELPVDIQKIDVDSDRTLLNEYGVTSIPTLLFFKDGKLIDRIVGIKPKSALVEHIKRLL